MGVGFFCLITWRLRREKIAMPEMLRVAQLADIEAVVVLAQEIWNQHFVPIIGQEQVDYMLEKFQSASAIAQQIADGYEYYIVREHDHDVGYFAIVPDRPGCQGQLSDLPRKSIEPMADAVGEPPRNLQQFLSLFRWDDAGVGGRLQQYVAREPRKSSGRF